MQIVYRVMDGLYWFVDGSLIFLTVLSILNTALILTFHYADFFVGQEVCAYPQSWRYSSTKLSNLKPQLPFPDHPHQVQRDY